MMKVSFCQASAVARQKVKSCYDQVKMSQNFSDLSR